jgi:hypothetical protein
VANQAISVRQACGTKCAIFFYKHQHFFIIHYGSLVSREELDVRIIVVVVTIRYGCMPVDNYENQSAAQGARGCNAKPRIGAKID